MAENVYGILKLRGGGRGELRVPERNLRAQSDDVRVSREMIRAHGLVEGAGILGTVRQNRHGRELEAVAEVGGLTPVQFAARQPYTKLTAVDPTERFCLAAANDASMRIMDLVAPIGRGTRGLIVSPPKAGKTMLLMAIAHAIRAAHPTTRIIVLLIDERPEEVTHFRRSVAADVWASSSDHGWKEHIELTELTMAHLRTELECGRHVVVLVDSLTRMGRAFNARGSGTRRTMSGGVEAGALEIPRRFFGMARNVEGGGSLTIIATVLIDTGSRMDELIFQEFKGTGNSEIVLDRLLAESRVFPAVDIGQSGTRKEHLLFDSVESQVVGGLRRMLAGYKPLAAMRSFLTFIEKYPTNEALMEEARRGARG